MIRKEDIRNFDTIMVTSKNFIGNSIREFTGAYINHVGVCVWIDDVLYISESERYGLRLTVYEDFLKKKGRDKFYIASFRLEVTERIRYNFMHYVISQTGHKPYDFMNLLFYQPIKQITKRLFKKPLWLGDRENKADRSFICTEWGAYLYNKFFSICEDWYLVSPDWWIDNNYFTVKKLN